MTDEHAHPFPWRLMAIVAVIVVVATVLAGIALERNSVTQQPEPVPTAAATASPGSDQGPVPRDERRQLTVLLLVRDAEGRAMSSVLLGVGGQTGYVAQLLLPRTLLLPTVPPIQLQEAASPIGLVTAQGPVETLLGVNVDAVVDLERLAWIGLLDSLGGVVDPDRASRPETFPLVLSRVLQGLPNRDEDLIQLLTSLGSMAQLTVSNEDAAALLLDLRQGQRTLPTRREVLPVTTLRAGSREASVLQQPEADAVLRELFAEALLQPGHPGLVRVVLVRAGASVGATTAARLDLVADGYGVVVSPGGAADGEAVGTTRVVVPTDDPEVVARGRGVAESLGLPASAVVVDAGPQATVDVRVELGADMAVR